jgi:activator of HSP90 ATPase
MAAARYSTELPCATGRRRWMLGAAFTSAGLLLPSSRVRAGGQEGLSHDAEAIHQEIGFKASPTRVYEALLDAAQFQKIALLSAATQALHIAENPAQIQRQPGGEFSIFAAYIVGRQIELVPSQRIVQAWRVSAWAPGSYSIAKFELVPEGAGTRILFDHTGFPAGTGDHLAAGWKSNYWDPMEKYFAQS